MTRSRGGDENSKLSQIVSRAQAKSAGEIFSGAFARLQQVLHVDELGVERALVQGVVLAGQAEAEL